MTTPSLARVRRRLFLIRLQNKIRRFHAINEHLSRYMYRRLLVVAIESYLYTQQQQRCIEQYDIRADGTKVIFEMSFKGQDQKTALHYFWPPDKLPQVNWKREGF